MSSGGKYRGLSRRLLNKSVEAYVLSLETINRLSITYRVENFAYLICNAWELLMKAKLSHESGTGAIYYPSQRGDRPRTISLRDCLTRTFLSERDPVRLNIEHVADLRDEAVHLVITQVPREVLGLFQAGVINYHKYLTSWTGVSLSDRVPVGMMTLVYDFKQEEHDLDSAVMRRRLGRNAVKYLSQFQVAIRADMSKLGNPPELSIDITYRLALTKTPGPADIVLTSGPGDGTAIRVVEVAKDPSKTHPLRLMIEVKLKVEENTGLKLNQHDLQCIVRVHGIKKRPEFYYKGTVPGNPSQYSPQFVDWITNQYKNDPQFFTKARREAAKLNRGNRKPSASLTPPPSANAVGERPPGGVVAPGKREVA